MQLEKGPATAAAVLDMVTRFPERHSQGRFTSPCGTWMCAAGWAAHLHGYSTQQIEALLTPGTTPHPIYVSRYLSRIAEVAGELLGLDNSYDRHQLFYASGEARAVEALEWIAAGKDLDWEEISNRAFGRSPREEQC